MRYVKCVRKIFSRNIFLHIVYASIVHASTLFKHLIKGSGDTLSGMHTTYPLLDRTKTRDRRQEMCHLLARAKHSELALGSSGQQTRLCCSRLCLVQGSKLVPTSHLLAVAGRTTVKLLPSLVSHVLSKECRVETTNQQQHILSCPAIQLHSSRRPASPASDHTQLHTALMCQVTTRSFTQH